MNKTLLSFSLLASVLLLAPPAEARGGPFGGGGRGWGRGHGRGKGMRGPMRCMKRLFHAPPFALKERMGLSPQQVKTVVSVRDNFFNKHINLRAEVDRTRLKMRKLMQQDLPPVKQVLKVMRKKRSLKGKIKEERIKALLKILGTLTPDQRKNLRQRCHGPRGFRGRFGPAGRGGRGMGRGMGPGGR